MRYIFTASTIPPIFLASVVSSPSFFYIFLKTHCSSDKDSIPSAALSVDREQGSSIRGEKDLIVSNHHPPTSPNLFSNLGFQFSSVSLPSLLGFPGSLHSQESFKCSVSDTASWVLLCFIFLFWDCWWVFLKHVGFYSLPPQQKHLSIFFPFFKSSGMRWVCETERCMSSCTPLFRHFCSWFASNEWRTQGFWLGYWVDANSAIDLRGKMGSGNGFYESEEFNLDAKWLVDPKLLFVGPRIGEGAHAKVYEGK